MRCKMKKNGETRPRWKEMGRGDVRRKKIREMRRKTEKNGETRRDIKKRGE